MKWRLITPYISEMQRNEWIELVTKEKDIIKLLEYGRLECQVDQNTNKDHMYFIFDTTKHMFELYKTCTKSFAESSYFKDMPTICPKEKKDCGFTNVKSKIIFE